MILTAIKLSESGVELSDEAIRHGSEGNLCRCTGPHTFVKAARAAAEMR